VIITIMALELKAPDGGDFASLRARLPALLIYILSFTFIGIYWNNHHHLLRAARRITGEVMWANLHLLFWLSLIPVLTEWIGDHHGSTAPAATYGVVCLGAAVAFTILTRAIIRADGSASPVAQAVGRDVKGRASVALYAAATALAFVDPWISYALFAAVSVLWFVPDRRLTRSDIVLGIDSTDLVEPWSGLQAEAAADDFLLDLGGAAEDGLDTAIGPGVADQVLAAVAVLSVRLHAPVGNAATQFGRPAT
jgi:uncharacterized membrane protein